MSRPHTSHAAVASPASSRCEGRIDVGQFALGVGAQRLEHRPLAGQRRALRVVLVIGGAVAPRAAAGRVRRPRCGAACAPRPRAAHARSAANSRRVAVVHAAVRPRRASAIGTSPWLNRIVRPTVDAGEASAAATTAATSALLTAPDSLASASMRPVGSCSVRALGATIVQSSSLARRCSSAAAFASAYAKKRVALRHAVVGPRAEVRHHHIPPHARGERGIHRADRGIPIDGVGARGGSASGAGRPHDRVVPVEQRRQPGDVERLDIRDHGGRARRRDLVRVLGVADDARHVVAARDQQRGEQQRDLAVAADDEDA